ncbi:MAG: hypothetical protein ACJ754_14965 [Pyrinomonadaceae bacterium]
MSEESILRLENAMATLAEISAQHNERLAAIEHSNQRLEQTTQRLEQTTQRLEQTTQRLEQGFQTLTGLAAHQDERQTGMGRTTQTLAELAADHQQLMANLQQRVTGLEEANATVVELLRRHHDGITEMRAAQANADAKIAALADAQIRTEAAMERGNERVQTALAQLAESQTHTDQRLDALIDIVRGSRNGESDG